MYAVDIPAQKAVFVRDGFQELLAAESGGPFFDVAIERGVATPMRDVLPRYSSNASYAICTRAAF